jgi:undecaprenyl diphosphate synthase
MTSPKKKKKKSLNSKSASVSDVDLDLANLPAHVAIIMDGNGRWAKRRLLSRIQGHQRGAEVVRTVVRTCRQIGIPHLTLYAFSTENWQRPKTEVNALMSLLVKFLKAEKKELMENDIRLNVIGEIERLPIDVQKEISRVKEATAANSSMVLHLALSYGSRSEIIMMVRNIAGKVKNGEMTLDAISDEVVSQHLYTRGIPDPDLLIRTSGEMRISNFLLWQIAYTELAVTDTLWPDFTKTEFLQIIQKYQKRSRRFGKLDE